MTPWEAQAGAGLLAGLVTLWKGPMLEQSVPEGLQPGEGTLAGAVCEELQPMGRTHVGEVHGGLSPVGGTPWWSRGRVRSPRARRKEQQRQRVMN